MTFSKISDIHFLYSLFFISSIFLSFASTPIFKSIAIKFQVLDFPRQKHKTHTEPVPYLGGFAIVTPFVLLFGVFLLAVGELNLKILFAAVVPSSIMLFVGFFDDLRNVKPVTKLAYQAICSIMAAWFLIELGFAIEFANNLALGFVLSFSWIVGITNSMNLLDNHDGATVGVSAIQSAFVFLIAFRGEQHLVAVLAVVLCGACLGFMYWNFPPASIYLGDTGSLFIGIITAILLIQLDPVSTSAHVSLIIPIFLGAIPILDTLIAIVGRFSRNVSPLQGGKDHISHRLMALGFSKKQTLALILSISFSFCIMALTLSEVNRLAEAILFFGIIVFVALFFYLLKLDH